MNPALPAALLALLAPAGAAFAPLQATEAPDGKEDGESDSVRVVWDDGLWILADNGDFEIRLGGRIQQDWAFFNGDRAFPSGPMGEDLLADGTEIRRARLSTRGTVHATTRFAVEYEFATPAREDGADAVGLRDAWVERTDLPGTPRFGHFFEPFGLEAQTDARALTFFERSLPSLAFAPGRNAGFGVGDTFADGAASWSAGVFRQTDDSGFDTGSGEHALTGRVTFAPQHETRSVVHLGLAYSLRDASDDGERYLARPEANLLVPFADTGLVRAKRSHLVGAEAAWAEGPLSLQAEAMVARVVAPSFGDPTFHGASVQGTWMLTGESRPYLAGGVFGRTRPARPLRKDAQGFGAVELAARYSMLDLEDDGATGGELRSTSLGVNWLLDDSTRVQLGYVGVSIDGAGPVSPGDSVDMLMLRFELDF